MCVQGWEELLAAILVNLSAQKPCFSSLVLESALKQPFSFPSAVKFSPGFSSKQTQIPFFYLSHTEWWWSLFERPFPTIANNKYKFLKPAKLRYSLNCSWSCAKYTLLLHLSQWQRKRPGHADSLRLEQNLHSCSPWDFMVNCSLELKAETE